MNKNDILEQIRQEAFHDELLKCAAMDDDIESRKQRAARSFAAPKYKIQPSATARRIAEDVRAIASGAKKAVTSAAAPVRSAVQQRSERAEKVFGRAGQYKIGPSKPAKPAVMQMASSK